jgi:uncharacterized membrane protein YoaK (UPF0700 family)
VQHLSDHQQQAARRSAILLCFGAGATDVLSYLTLGQIFTSAMTGCAALLFLKSTAHQYPVAFRAALALASYMLGCALGTLLQPRDESRIKSPATLRRLLTAECALLGIYCLLSADQLHPAGMLRETLIALSAIAMGVQSIVARDLQEPGISTVVLNPTMTSLGVALTKVLLRRERKLPAPNRLQILVLLSYATGALIAAAGITVHITIIPLLPLAAAGGVWLLYQTLIHRQDA